MESYPLITIYHRQHILEHFNKSPNIPITVEVPASGSWYETFDNKEQYLKRMDIWDKIINGSFSGSWKEFRGKVSYPKRN